jgi:hypothetical protein
MARQISKTWVIVLIVLVAVLAGLTAVGGGILVGICLGDMRDMGLHSEMSFLNTAIREHLQQYFEQEDHYPDSLDMVTQSILETSYRKNADQPKILSWLSCFHYSSTGDTYILTWSLNKHGNLWTKKEYGKNGAFVKWELYVDGKLHRKGKMK